ncbi:Crooked neck-like protein 1, partial [Cichlidogyrus casuarinus]
YAELETLLGEVERARAIYNLAVKRSLLDMPELLWKGFIDFEIEQHEWERARELYARLMDNTKHVKVWLSLANFELCAQEELDDMEAEAAAAVTRARQVYRRANKTLKEEQGDKEQRVKLIEAWKEFETEYGEEDTLEEVLKIEPKRVVRTRRNADSGWEEYVEYIFPDLDAEQPNKKLLTLAAQWQQKHVSDADDSVSSSSEDDDEDAPSQIPKDFYDV